MKAKGKLLIIGGHEDRSDNEVEMKKVNNNFSPYEILRLLAVSENDRIEVVTAASSEPDSLRKTYHETFSKLGYTNVGFLHLNEEDIENDCQRISKAKTVFFTGGDQNRICEKLTKSPAMKVLKEKYFSEKEFMVAGTSAGAMCLPEIIICEAENGEAIVGNDLTLGSGLGLLKNSIVDTHFVERGRFGRLAHAVLQHQQLYGIGLGEDTALLIENDKAVCRGSGMVMVLNAENITKTNVDTVKKGYPVYAENLKVNMLTDGCSLDFSDGSITGVDQSA